MANPFVLTCLGFPELQSPDGRVVRIRVKKHLALLVYLAVERRRSHDRSRLVELFWPRSSPERGRHSCATALSLLRTFFGRSAFATTRNGLRFSPANLTLDLDRLDAGDIVGTDGEAIIDVDGFLRGFDIDDAPEFTLWKEREHARRLPSIHAGLLTLIDHGRRRGSHDEIMKRAERLLSVDHLAEEGIRAKMEALALVGDRFSALRVFDEWKEQLARELMAEPSMTVQGMASQLRKRGWQPKEPNPVPAVPAEQWRDRRFVGRKHEYRRLYETWEAVHQHHPRHFLIAGDSGVGKTTLAQRLVTAAGLEGASVSRVQCYQLEQRIPFAAIGGLVTGLLGRPGVAATAPEALAEVARIVPQVKTHFPTLPPPKPSEGESARLLFAEGVIDLLRAVMDERPLLLVMDDVHHVDEASMAVLHLVMRRIDVGRFMVALTLRHGEIVEPLAFRLLESAHRLPLETMPLEPLDPSECRELLTTVLPAASMPSTPERNALVRASKGYPMVLELLADDWRAHGTACLGLAMVAMTTTLVHDASAPADPYAALAQRLLASLPFNSKQVLVLAAILGGRVDDLGVYSIADLSIGQTIDGLSDLSARRVFRDVGSGLEFINELLRAHIYRCIPGPTRVRLHGAIADWAIQSGQHLSKFAVAWHLMRANQPQQAAGFLLQGAVESLDKGGPDEAVLALQSALPELPSSHKDEALLLLVEGFHELGRWQDGLTTIASLGEVSGDPRVRVFEIEARWRLGTLHHDGPEAAVEELAMIAQPRTATGAKAAQVAALVAGSLQSAHLLEALRESLTIGEELPQAVRAGYRTAQAIAAYYCRDLEAAQQAALDAHSILTQSGAGGTNVLLLEIGLGAIASSQGQYEESAARHRRAGERARAIDNERLHMQASAGLSLALLRLGKLTEVLELSKSIPIPPDLYRNPTVGVSVATLAYSSCCALALSGKSADALHRLSSEGLAELDLCSHAWTRQVWRLYKSDVFWLAGQRRRAVREADLTIADAPHPLSQGVIGSLCRWRAIVDHVETSADTERLLDEQARSLRNLDLIDQLEVLHASAHFRGRREPIAARAHLDQAREVAAALPPTAVEFIEHFFQR